MLVKKEIYLNTTNYDSLNLLKNNGFFKRPHEYDTLDYMNAHRNEYGMFDLDDLKLKIIVGQIPNYNCHWCKHSLEMKAKIPNFPKDYLNITRNYCVYLECPNCLSRGPTIDVADKYYDKMEEYIHTYLKEIYSNIIPWDNELKKENT